MNAVPTNNRLRILLQNNLKIILQEDTNAEEPRLYPTFLGFPLFHPHVFAILFSSSSSSFSLAVPSPPLSTFSFFRCPISLDVMKFPINLSTGVTYDRSSIQRWLDNGNNTCPATMQVLQTKEFVPNRTLQRFF